MNMEPTRNLCSWEMKMRSPPYNKSSRERKAQPQYCSAPIKVFPKDPKGKGKSTPPAKSKKKSVQSVVEEVPKKRKLVLDLLSVQRKQGTVLLKCYPYLEKF